MSIIDLRNYRDPQPRVPRDDPDRVALRQQADELMAVDFASWETKEQANTWGRAVGKWVHEWSYRRHLDDEDGALLRSMHDLQRRSARFSARLPDPEGDRRRELARIESERRRAADPEFVLLGRLAGLIDRWRGWLLRLEKRLVDALFVDVWITALRAGGFKADRARGERVRTAKGSFAVPVEFALELRCPEGHRTADRRNTAAVQFVILENAWFEFDPEHSSCQQCTVTSIDYWIWACPMCLAGEWDETHDTEHGPWEQWVEDGLDGPVVHGSRAPVAYLLRAFEQVVSVAEAQWIDAHSDEATEAQVAAARAILAAQPAPKASAKTTDRPAWSKESATAWLVAHGIAADLSARQTWLAVHATEGHPPRRWIEEAQPRKTEVAAPPA